MKLPSGNFHCFILSGDAEAKVNLKDEQNETSYKRFTYSEG